MTRPTATLTSCLAGCDGRPVGPRTLLLDKSNPTFVEYIEPQIFFWYDGERSPFRTSVGETRVRN